MVIGGFGDGRIWCWGVLGTVGFGDGRTWWDLGLGGFGDSGIWGWGFWGWQDLGLGGFGDSGIWGWQDVVEFGAGGVW